MILFGTLVVWEFDVYLAVNLLFGHDEPSAVKLWSCEAVKLWSCEAVNFARYDALCQVLRTVLLKNFFYLFCKADKFFLFLSLT